MLVNQLVIGRGLGMVSGALHLNGPVMAAAFSAEVSAADIGRLVLEVWLSLHGG